MSDPHSESSAPNSPPEARPPAVEHTHWSMGLVGFYLSCAGVSLGAAIAFGGYFFFESKFALSFGIAMSAISSVTCFFALRAARRPPAARS